MKNNLTLFVVVETPLVKQIYWRAFEFHSMAAWGDLNVYPLIENQASNSNDLFSWRVKKLNECLKDSVC